MYFMPNATLTRALRCGASGWRHIRRVPRDTQTALYVLDLRPAVAFVHPRQGKVISKYGLSGGLYAVYKPVILGCSSYPLSSPHLRYTHEQMLTRPIGLSLVSDLLTSSMFILFVNSFSMKTCDIKGSSVRGCRVVFQVKQPLSKSQIIF